MAVAARPDAAVCDGALGTNLPYFCAKAWAMSASANKFWARGIFIRQVGWSTPVIAVSDLSLTPKINRRSRRLTER